MQNRFWSQGELTEVTQGGDMGVPTSQEPVCQRTERESEETWTELKQPRTKLAIYRRFG